MTTAPERRCDARLLALLEHRDRHVAEPLGDLRVLLEQLPEPDRAREPGGPGADDEDADLDPLVGGSVGRRRRLRSGGGTAAGTLGRAGVHVSRSFALPATSSVSFGTICVHVADDAEVAELEDRRVRVLVDRDDHARALHADLVLDRAGDAAARRRASARPSCRSGRPAPSTGTSPRRRRRASRRPRRRAPCASSSTSAKFSGPPSPRPPATITSASSIDGPSLLLVRLLEHRRGEREVLEARRRPPRPRRSPPRLGRLERAGAEERDPRLAPSSRRRRRRSRRAPAASRRARRRCSTRSMRSQLSPASSRAASPAATSAASTEAANRTVSKPSSRTSCASTSTRGCGSGASSAASSAT